MVECWKLEITILEREQHRTARNTHHATPPISTIYDISLPLSDDLAVWPDDAPVRITRGDGLPAISRIAISSHAGTHVDPPAHFIAGGGTVDQLALDRLVGPAWVAHLPGPGPITAARLAAAGIPDGPIRLLLRTDNSARPATRHIFDRDFVALAPDAAGWLLDHGIQLIGIDGPSIEPFVAPGDPVHHALLGAGMIVVENLALEAIAPGAYGLICLPLPIARGDGAPARAILICDTQDVLRAA